MTARGKERLVFHDFTYYKQSRTKSGFRWGCTKNRWHKCKAYLHLADDLTIVRTNFIYTTRGQKLLMYDKFTFFRSGWVRNGGSRYSCSHSVTKRCKAHIHVHKDCVILMTQSLPYTTTTLTTMFIHTTRGQKLLMYGKYSFYRSGPIRNGGSRYSCSRLSSQQCKAHIHLSKDDDILMVQAAHNHDPDTYLKTKAGLYLKVYLNKEPKRIV
ncbi:unnamed protein product, partial [Iphiclides podalirius]